MKRVQATSRRAGFVLVNALVIVAAMAAAATLLLSRAEGGRARLIATQDADALTHALDAFEVLGRSVLTGDLQNGALDTLDEAWADTISGVPLARGRVSGVITDQQALFNLNWLADPDDVRAQEGWTILLGRLGFSASKGEAITRFLSPEGPSNREAYARLDPPIQPIGGSLLLVDQLQSLIALDRDDIEKLRPHITVLPASSQVNVNTASLDVLAAMLPELSIARLNKVIVQRQKEPYPSREAFFEDVGLSIDPEDPEAIDPTRFSVGSNWFATKITAELATRRATRVVLYRREGLPAGAQVEWRVSQYP